MLKINRAFVQGVEKAPNCEGLHYFVQKAIELEHATIPPYLTAMFSLKRGTNDHIRQIIHSVVIEEMLHMCIASNLLNALGGAPVINKKDFVPSYPGPLPLNIGSKEEEEGKVAIAKKPVSKKDEFIVNLTKYSLEQVRSTFMRIEQPETEIPIEDKNFDLFPGGDAPMLAAADVEEDFATIGEFYEAISKRVEALYGPDQELPGDASKQVTSSFYQPNELFPITHCQHALAAIEVIVEQGEGTSSSPFDSEGELSHFYKFMELSVQRTIHKGPGDDEYYFGQPSIPFNPKDVWNIQSNVKAKDLLENTAARINLNEFNATYTRLLNGLHITFNGQPDYLEHTFGLMYDVKLAGEKLCATPFPDKDILFVGPSFEFVKLPMTEVL